MRTPALGIGLLAVALIALPGRAEARPDPHRDHAGLNARLQALVSAHPQTARVHKVTTTPQGRDVLALEVDLDGRFDDTAPVLLLHGAIHGDEWISAEVVLHLAELALATADARLRGLRLHFVPVINADGFAAGRRQAVDTDGTWYDPNRDFPVPYTADRPSRAPIAAFRAYARRGRLAAVLDYHSPAVSMSWPWAFSRVREPDGVAPLKQVVEDMARSVGFRAGQTSKIISYRHQGTAQDWFAYAFNVPAVLMELDWSPVKPDHAVQELFEQERPFWIFVTWLKAREAAAARPAAASPPPAAGKPSSR